MLHKVRVIASVFFQYRKEGFPVKHILKKTVDEYKQNGLDGVKYIVTRKYRKISTANAPLTQLQVESNRPDITKLLEDEYQGSKSLPPLYIEIKESMKEEDFLINLEQYNHFHIKEALFEQYILGDGAIPMRIFPQSEDKKNATVALEIAKTLLTTGDLHNGYNYLQFSLSFLPLGETYELLGNYYLEKQKYKVAIDCYLQAKQNEFESEWLEKNFNLVISQYYQHKLEELTLAFHSDNDRTAYSNTTSDLASYIYSKLLEFYTHKSTPIIKKLATNQILIIADYHISQCVRYRINQKKEQLENQGYDVITQNWIDLSENTERISQADIVIFYRTPATPETLKAVARTHAFGKLSFFEADDLMFDTDFPPPLETYGGSIDFDVYQSLVKSMVLTRSMAELCEYGIASTRPLQTALSSYVKKNRCILHRNGLDKENIYLPKSSRNSSKSINIFYGSGTLAHNSDFTVGALPAISRIMEKHTNVNLIIVGHLTLPPKLLERFSNRIKAYPKTKTVKDYFELLNKATISIATLDDNKFNGAKSELKWFEAAYLNVPSVVSSTDNYRDVIRNGENGFIVANSQEWFEALEKLVTDQGLCEKIAKQAHKEVIEKYSIETLGLTLSDQFQQIVNAENKKIPAKKKMALVNVFFPPQTIGGATRVVSDNFDVMKEKYGDEYDIVVFTTESECVEPYQVSLYNYKNTIVYKSSILWRENMDWHPKDVQMYNIFQEFLTIEQPDFVHFHCLQRMTASVVEATLDNNIPYFITVHDAWWISDYQFLVDPKGKVFPEGHPNNEEDLVLPNNVTKEESKIRTSALKHLLNNAEKALVVSDSFARIYEKNGIHNTVTTRNGLSTSINWQLKQTDYTDKVVCALIGGMSAHKGYELLQNTISQYQPENIELLIVDLSKPASYELNDKWGSVSVRFVGKQTSKTIVSLYQQIDVLLAPSIWPESYGLVSREAAACGCWVVASNLGGMGEDVIEGETGFVIEPTIQALGQTLELIGSQVNKFKGVAKMGELRFVTQQVDELMKYYRGI